MTAGYSHRRVFTVPPGIAFLPAVADALLDGRLVPGFAWNGDPMSLARATIYVPTRRAARELRSVFMDALGAETILLPRIRPLGEFDEDAAFFAGDGTTALDIAPAIDPLERQLALGTMIARWTDAMTDQLYALYGEERLTTPVSTADAFWMAADLGALIDQLETERIDFERIEAAAAAEVSQWWQVTLAFLQIVKRGWPDYLAERSRLDPAAHRNAMLRAEAERLRASPPDGPIVVAGSTGTINATADLIAAIARLPQGAAVLPGYDSTLDAPTRALLDAPGEIASVIGHPQFGMRKLVRTIGVAHDAVEPLATDRAGTRAERRQWVAAALAPAPRTGAWADQQASLTERAFDDVAILHAANERAEALAIACALRAAILEPGKTAALVTPDRNLARRVSAELQRFGINADDSGGTAFALTPQGILLALAVDLARGEADPATLLALLKHPLARFGATEEDHAGATHLIEMMVLRGGTGRITLAAFSAFAEAGLTQWADDRRRKPDWFARITPDDFARVRALSSRIEAAFAPLAELPNTDLRTVGRATVAVLEAIATDADGAFGTLYAGDAGQALEGFLSRLLECPLNLDVAINEWPDMLRALTATLAIKPDYGGHPRIAIWGALEARLQSVDLMVLGGLNDGVWPAQTTDDAFLTRRMKDEIGLQPPERRIGLAAHDLQMALGQPSVLLTRSQRQGNTPSVASRWLQRLETLAGRTACARMRAEGARYTAIADAVDHPVTRSPAPRPAPKPPIAARPKRLSVTEVETLRRDPYAIHARKVLRLKRLDPLVRDPDFADRGALIHAVMEEAARAGIDFTGADAVGTLTGLARTVFDADALPPEIDALWWARMSAAIPNIVAWERDRDPGIKGRLPELSARPTAIAGTDVVLTGRADRIDPRHDGGADIIDFKTGAAPSLKQVDRLLAPQLPLEAALLARGAFADVTAEPADLIYVRLGPRGEIVPTRVNGGKNDDAATLAERAWEKLTGLAHFYADPANGYTSRVMPVFENALDGEYDHLARAHEWINAPSGTDRDG